MTSIGQFLRLKNLCVFGDGDSARAPGPKAGGCDVEIGFIEGLPPGDHLTGLDRVGFEVPSREQVNLIYDEATRLQIRATRPRVYEGRWLTFVFDPDGYKIEVFAQAG